MTNLESLQAVMIEKGYDAYIIATSDFHNSEYVSEHFKGRSFISGFTGSAGTLVITQNEARLWTDGRYFIQAEAQIANSNIYLMKSGLEGIPTIKEYLQSILRTGGIVGFDGRTLSFNLAMTYTKNLKNVTIKTDEDLLDYVWTDRPALPFSMVYKLDEFFCGEAKESKIEKIRSIMKEEKVSTHVLTALEDQAWLFNLRANDVKHTPVFLSFTIITNDDVYLFIDVKKLNEEITSSLKHSGVTIKDYNSIYSFCKEIKNQQILIDPKYANYEIVKILKENNYLIEKANPSLLLKAIKNDVEIANTKLAHIKDGAAFTKFMYYVKTNVGKKQLSEISVSDYLEQMRRNQPGLVDISFDTICGYKEHAAMMHYSATKESDYLLKPEGLLLIDSGGHYLEGTTDLTRTISLGKISKEMKLHFTTVLKSVIALSKAVFIKGCKGINLDILARGPIWNLLLDYKCGTGHGVGYLLSVHEGPNGFRWQVVPERNDSSILRPGMITTNEPGIYLENQYGIRTEQELLVVDAGKTEFGEFYRFETISFAPIDLDCIDASLLTKEEKAWLNAYHQEVFEKLSPLLTSEEVSWLLNYTKAIK